MIPQNKNLYLKVSCSIILATLFSTMEAQNMDISDFTYRDFLDLGQNKGAFNPNANNVIGNANITFQGKDSSVTLPNSTAPILNRDAQSNFGSGTSVGQGVIMTASHVKIFTDSTLSNDDGGRRSWGSSRYNVLQHDPEGVYGYDTKFHRVDKYIVEGETGVLNVGGTFQNTTEDKTKQTANRDLLIKKLNDDFKDPLTGKVYGYMAGSGTITLRGPSGEKLVSEMSIQGSDLTGQYRGGGVGVIDIDSGYYVSKTTTNNFNNKGIRFGYNTRYDGNEKFVNTGTTGDSGSTLYAYNYKDNEWQAVGVVSQGENYLGSKLYYSLVDESDVDSFKDRFQQEIDLTNSSNSVKLTLSSQKNPEVLYKKNTGYSRTSGSPQKSGDRFDYILSGGNLKNTNTKTTKSSTNTQGLTLEQNKDIIFSSNKNVEIDVKNDIDLQQKYYVIAGKYEANQYVDTQTQSGGLVFKDSTQPITYKFKSNKDSFQNLSSVSPTSAGSPKKEIATFKGSGLDIGKNVTVEWGLANQSNDNLHKVGEGTLKVNTLIDAPSGNLKIGEGKVILDTNKQVYNNIYITSGRGGLELVSGKGEALGATKSTSQTGSGSKSGGVNSYTLAQDEKGKMGFYFGKGGGELDLKGNSLKLNTIAATDSKGVITNTDSTNKATLEIEGYGYGTSTSGSANQNQKDTSKKADTLIHGSIGKGVIESLDSKSSATTAVSSAANQNAQNGYANIDLKYSGDGTGGTGVASATQAGATPNTGTQDSQNTAPALIFDGNIFTKGKFDISNKANVTLQGHATTHAYISDEANRNLVIQAQQKAGNPFDDSIDLSKPSTLKQSDWDERGFVIQQGINLTNSSLNIGRNAHVDSNITSDKDSKITLGGSVTHYIDNIDSNNITGNGFSFDTKIEKGSLDETQQKLANESTSYKGKITAKGGSIESNIKDFNASLDLSEGAKLNASDLVLNANNEVKIKGSGTSAEVKNLTFQNITSSDANKPTFDVGDSTGSGGTSQGTFSVTESLTFDNATYDLSKLNSNVKLDNLDIFGKNGSQVTGKDKELSANVNLESGASLELKSLKLESKSTATSTLQDSNADSNDAKNTKDSITLKGDNTTLKSETITATHLPDTKITLENKSKLEITKDIKITGQDSSTSQATIKVGEGAEIKTADAIVLDKIKNANIDIAKEGKITTADSAKATRSGTGADSKSAIIAKNGSVVNLKNSSENELNIQAQSGAKFIITGDVFKGQIITGDSNIANGTNSSASVVTASSSTSGFSRVTTTTILASSVNNTSSTGDSSEPTIDISAVENTTANIDLQDASSLKLKNLTLDNTHNSVNIAEGARLNAETITAKNLTGMTFSGDGSAYIDTLIYQQQSTATQATAKASVSAQSQASQQISVNTTINNSLQLQNVGINATAGDNRYHALDFTNNLTFGESARVQVSFDKSITKNATQNSTAQNTNNNGVITDKYYTLISAKTLEDNRKDKAIDFTFESNTSGAQNPYFVVSKIEDSKVKFKFLNDDPKSESELKKHLDSKYMQIASMLLEHDKNDKVLDEAVRTDDYSLLRQRLEGIDDSMRKIAASDTIVSNLLYMENQSINTRVSQVLLANMSQALSASNRALSQKYAANDINEIIALAAMNDECCSMSDVNIYRPLVFKEALNNAWASVSAGYFGGSESVGIYNTNLGYDRMLGDLLLGAMISVGGSSGNNALYSDVGFTFNAGLYAHRAVGNNELQTNLNFSLLNTRKTFSQVANNTNSTNYGYMLNLYYKYNFELNSSANVKQSIKPIIMLAAGLNDIGALSGEFYMMNAYKDFALQAALGIEYALARENMFYNFQLLARQPILNSAKDAQLSLARAYQVKTYEILQQTTTFEANIMAAHQITQAFYMQYSLGGLFDINSNFGLRGDLKFGYMF